MQAATENMKQKYSWEKGERERRGGGRGLTKNRCSSCPSAAFYAAALFVSVRRGAFTQLGMKVVKRGWKGCLPYTTEQPRRETLVSV